MTVFTLRGFLNISCRFKILLLFGLVVAITLPQLLLVGLCKNELRLVGDEALGEH